MNRFKQMFPKLCQLLEGTAFDQDIAAANDLPANELRGAIESSVYELNELVSLIYGAVFPRWWTADAVELEGHLDVIMSTVGIQATRNAFKRQFLVEAAMKTANISEKRKVAKDSLEDVRYEIAVTAHACKVLDRSSIQLERPIGDPLNPKPDAKNSDIYGEFKGQPVRIEVTVIHEDLPPAIDLDVEQIIAEASIPLGFYVLLGPGVVDKTQAERTRAIIELLCDHHVQTGGGRFEVDGVILNWTGHNYLATDGLSPVQRIDFYSPEHFPGAESIRDIHFPSRVRNLTPDYVREDFPNPPGVVTTADLPDSPQEVPLSSKIRSAIERKLEQCEDGLINIVALGIPYPMYDIDVDNALKGTALAAFPYWTDKNRERHLGEMMSTRASKAPFVPAEALRADNDQMQFIDPFRKLSAVWKIRLGSHSLRRLVENPNALMPIPAALSNALNVEDSPTKPKAISLARSARLDDSIDNRMPVWREIAANFVGVCGSTELARKNLSALIESARSLTELRNRVDELFLGGTAITMTNEEATMNFVIDCGGYVQACACLEAFCRELTNNEPGDKREA